VEVEDGVDALLFGGIDEAAGVDDDHIGISALIGDLIRFETAEHHFGVDKVLGAAEADEVEFFWHGVIFIFFVNYTIFVSYPRVGTRPTPTGMYVYFVCRGRPCACPEMQGDVVGDWKLYGEMVFGG
jgi:hypothetical protein